MPLRNGGVAMVLIASVLIGLGLWGIMIASTCLAVLFVPSFFVLLKRLEEWRGRRKQPHVAALPVE